MLNFAVIVPYVVILGLGGWTWYQSQMIDSLRAENRTQAQTIENQRETNRTLKVHLAAERQAVEKAEKSARALKETVGNVQREIRALLDKNACSDATLPTGVGDRIKRLHRQGGERQD